MSFTGKTKVRNQEDSLLEVFLQEETFWNVTEMIVNTLWFTKNIFTEMWTSSRRLRLTLGFMRSCNENCYLPLTDRNLLPTLQIFMPCTSFPKSDWLVSCFFFFLPWRKKENRGLEFTCFTLEFITHRLYSSIVYFFITHRLQIVDSLFLWQLWGIVFQLLKQLIGIHHMTSCSSFYT